MADGEVTYYLCNQMWPDTMWSTNIWPDGMWPVICELIYVHKGCVVNVNIDLRDQVIIKPDILSSFLILLNLDDEIILPLSIYNYKTLVTDLISVINLENNVKSVFDHETDLLANIVIPVTNNIVIPIDLESSITIRADVADTHDLLINLIDGYNIYVNLCLNGDCGCGE